MEQDKGQGQNWLTPQEVADELKVNYITVIRWINGGDLRAYRLGAQWRVKREDLDEWLEQKAQPGRTGPKVTAPAVVTAIAA
jgi:excisionase family DNA binding protein